VLSGINLNSVSRRSMDTHTGLIMSHCWHFLLYWFLSTGWGNASDSGTQWEPTEETEAWCDRYRWAWATKRV